MFAPIRNYKSRSFISDWAESWLSRGGGWDSRVYELAGFCPIKYRRLRRECTVLDIATAWKTMKALSEYAWNDGTA